MGVSDAPHWLGAAFVRAARDAGATAGDEAVEDAASRVLDRWAEPRRVYHGCRHLVDVLARVDELAPETQAPAIVRLAAFYHGAVFGRPEGSGQADDGNGPAEVPPGANWEDEGASAGFAREELAALGVGERATQRIVRLIEALADHTPLPGDFDSAVLSDATLALLAVEPQRYKEYLRQVREENAAIPLRDFLGARIAGLEAVLAKQLFTSPGAKGWEARARDNAGAELHRSRKALLREDLDAQLLALRAAEDCGDGADAGADAE